MGAFKAALNGVRFFFSFFSSDFAVFLSFAVKLAIQAAEHEIQNMHGF